MRSWYPFPYEMQFWWLVHEIKSNEDEKWKMKMKELFTSDIDSAAKRNHSFIQVVSDCANKRAWVNLTGCIFPSINYFGCLKTMPTIFSRSYFVLNFKIPTVKIKFQHNQPFILQQEMAKEIHNETIWNSTHSFLFSSAYLIGYAEAKDGNSVWLGCACNVQFPSLFGHLTECNANGTWKEECGAKNAHHCVLFQCQAKLQAYPFAFKIQTSQRERMQMHEEKCSALPGSTRTKPFLINFVQFMWQQYMSMGAHAAHTLTKEL